MAGHPLYRLATQVQRGKLTLAAAIARIDATSELRDLADSQLIELDRQIGQLSGSNRNLAHTLASLNYAVARAKGFRRVQVDCALRLSELTYDTHTRLNLLHEALTASQKSGYRRGEKVAQATLGKLYTQEGRGEDAIAAYRDQLESAKSGGYAAIDVESLLALGDLYREQNQLDEALETFERTVNAAGAAGQPSGQIEALTRAAEIYFLRGTPTAALDALDRGLVIAVDLKDARVEAELASLYGDLLRELRRIGEAATAYQRALTLTGEDVRRQVDILGRLVPLCIDLGAWQDGADYARQGLLLAAGNEPAQETLWLLDLAIALLELGRPLEAVDTARDGLAIAQIADPGGRLEHDALGRLGALLTETGDWTGAADALHKALTLSARLGDAPAEATWMTQLARCAWYAGDLSEAIQRYTDALTMARNLSDRSLEAHILGSLGTLLRDSGQARRGLEYYDEALELSKLAGDGREVVRYLTLLGRTYGELRHHDDAKRSFLEAIALGRKIDDKRGQVEAHRRYAALLRGRRDREGAIAQIAAAAALVGALDDPRLVTTTVQELAAIQEELGQWEESAASYRRLLSTAERSDDLSGKLQAHLQLGRLLQFQQPSESRQHLRQALDIAHEINDPQLIDQVSELLPTGTEDASSPLAD
ncbi:MAG TPA: tetratricopeptide repeat protein [Ktedonobacterales bacterium]